MSNFFHPLPLQAVDLITGYSAAAQISAALLLRERESKGSLIDLSMYDVAASTNILQYSNYFSNHKDVGDGKDMLTGRPCYDIYKTREDYVSVACLEPQFWERFCLELGLERFKDIKCGLSTGSQGKLVRSAVAEVLMTKTAEEWEEYFIDKKKELPVLRCKSPEELYGDQMLWDRKMIAHVGNDLHVLKPALDYQNFLREEKNSPAPAIGNDNDEFLKQ